MENRLKTQTATENGSDKRRNTSTTAWTLVLALATLSMTGCRSFNPRHGLILRGDWSIELNRIPWMARHNDCYQEPMQPPGCGPECGPNASGANTCGKTGCDASPCLRKGCALHGEGGPGAGGANESGVEYGNHPRFHPVPTKPVFSPRGPYANGMGGVPSEACQAIPRHIQQEPIPEPEVIPAPKPKPPVDAPSRGTSPAAPGLLKKTTSQSAWIFTPPPEPDLNTTMASKRTAAARSALR